MLRIPSGPWPLLAAATFLLGGCTETTGIDETDGLPNDQAVRIDFLIQRVTDGGTASAVAGWLASTSDVARPITADTVASLTVTVDSVQALPVNGDDGDDGAWVTVVLDAPVTLDLKALPTAGDSPLLIASGTLTAGDYQNVRLFISDATIMFTGPVSLGAAITYEPDTPYEVTVPSSLETGIKTDLRFTAEDGADANLLFDEGATFANVNVTGNGRVMLAPVIRAAPGGGE